MWSRLGLNLKESWDFWDAGFPHPSKENNFIWVVEILGYSHVLPSLAEAFGEGNAGGW